MSPSFESSRVAAAYFASAGTSTPLTNPVANDLRNTARSDAKKLLYYSLMTISDAISGIERRRYSWSIVKLYYSLFYAIRSILALNGYILTYINGKPLEIRCIAGAVARRPAGKIAGSTHKWSFFTFERNFPSSPIISQDIAGISPFLWMMKQREEVNYQRAICFEPHCPLVFDKIDGEKI